LNPFKETQPLDAADLLRYTQRALEKIDVFISYKREDGDDVAFLENALAGLQLTVWFDVRIPSGTDFGSFIEQKLLASQCVLVVWSLKSVNSSWVREEAREGLRRNILVPISIDGTPPPFGFRSVQTADLSGWRGDSQNTEWQRVLMRIGGMVQRSTALSDWYRHSYQAGIGALRQFLADHPADPLAEVAKDKIKILGFANQRGATDLDFGTYADKALLERNEILESEVAKLRDLLSRSRSDLDSENQFLRIENQQLRSSVQSLEAVSGTSSIVILNNARDIEADTPMDRDLRSVNRYFLYEIALGLLASIVIGSALAKCS
jgi:TIR domain